MLFLIAACSNGFAWRRLLALVAESDYSRCYLPTSPTLLPHEGRMTTWPRSLLPVVFLALGTGSVRADTPLHQRIDQLIAAGANGQAMAAVADDAEFLRRVYLDFAGRIPSVQEARAFLKDQAADRRMRLIDHLLNSADYPRRMQELFHVMLMERRGDHPEWTKYLRKSFEANKPWDQMAREILRAAPRDETTRGSAFFYAKRLEHYGENPIDYPGLTRDVGRLFLGKDLRCAQCHDHLFVRGYKQQDYQGLFAFFQNLSLHDAAYPTVSERPLEKKVAYASVFRKVPKQVGPRLPGGPEFDVLTFPKGQELRLPANAQTKFPGVPRFSPLEKLAEQLPRADNADFVRNSVNRLWFVLMGRGLVHPLDLHHAGNPPSHPELLDLLSREFVAHKFDIKWMLRELVLTTTYQRSSLLPEGKPAPPADRFLVMPERRLSAEQLIRSLVQATGTTISAKEMDALQAKFVKAFANPPGEAEDSFTPSLKGALFLLNDTTVQTWLTPRPGNLLDRLAKLPDAAVADELYLSVLTRPPTAEERDEVVKYLAKNGARRPAALGHLTWALLASTEFCVNH